MSLSEYRSLLVICLCFGISCSPQSAEPESGLSPQQEMLFSDSSWTSGVSFRGTEPVLAAAGLKPLLHQPLPHGHRELRIWALLGRAWPQWLYRITADSTGVVGEALPHWPTGGFGESDSKWDSLMVQHLEGRGLQCASLHASDQMTVCRLGSTPPRGWPIVLQELEKARVWEIPYEDVIPAPDAAHLIVELRVGPLYRAYEYRYPYTVARTQGNPTREIALVLESLW